jgi:hypothetical protein
MADGDTIVMTTLAKPDVPTKYTAQVWAGLIDDPMVLERERQRRAAPPPRRAPRGRPTARPAPRWIPIGGGAR